MGNIGRRAVLVSCPIFPLMTDDTLTGVPAVNTVVTQAEQDMLVEISRLLAEAYAHFFSYEGHCKSSEGHISLEFGNLWGRENPTRFGVTGISVYSYVFCTEGRSQAWDTIAEALETVREWHAVEMAYDPNAPEEVAGRKAADAAAAQFLDEMAAAGKLDITIVNVSGLDDLGQAADARVRNQDPA